MTDASVGADPGPLTGLRLLKYLGFPGYIQLTWDAPSPRAGDVLLDVIRGSLGPGPWDRTSPWAGAACVDPATSGTWVAFDLTGRGSAWFLLRHHPASTSTCSPSTYGEPSADPAAVAALDAASPCP